LLLLSPTLPLLLLLLHLLLLLLPPPLLLEVSNCTSSAPTKLRFWN
jgi:hypothetical protein